MYQMTLDDELIVDNFAGGGGASLGIEMALNRPVDIAINHDSDAIGMHEINHPMTRHYCESVWDVDPTKVCNGRPVGLAWFSPDCKHFSKAKGKSPVEKNIRGLAWVAVRWAGTVKPRIIMLENVEEFVTWGPLRQMRDENGLPLHHEDGRKMMEPCPNSRGMTFKSFVKALKTRGYVVEWRELRACDYGAPTIRKRLFMIARRDGQPIIWPKATHGKTGTGLLPYRTAAECIDWSIKGKSIFERERPLKENTMRRIAKGIKKFVLDCANPFIVTLNHSGEGFRGHGVDEPFKTMTAARDAHALVTPFIQHVQHGSAVSGTMPADEPFRTITSTPKGGGMALVSPYLVGAGGPARAGEPRAADIPMGSVIGKNNTALVMPHLSQMFGASVGHGVEQPINALTSKDKAALVSAFVVKHFGGMTGVDIRTPFPTIMTRGTQNQLCTSHIMKMRGENIGHPTNEPLHTVSAGGMHHAEVRAFLIKYFGTDQDPHLEDPMHTVTTKDRFGIVTVAGELYQIIDIFMRMLIPRELYRAQSFPDSWIISHTAGGKKLTQTAQVKMCGNSVPPLMAKALAGANWSSTIFTGASVAHG